ncbi:MAG: hypothetical protein CMH57_04155 [Myxococcales bacterium]|nr:hypothetical protein [Myxococcales bacterium]
MPRTRDRRYLARTLTSSAFGGARRLRRTNPFTQVEVNHHTFTHPRIDARTQGLRLAHLTDIHYGPWIRGPELEALVRFVNAQEVDLVVLTGDYVGHRRSDIAPCVEPMAGFNAPTFATLGNHDYKACHEETQRAFDAIGVPVLVNASTRVTTARGHQLTVVGVDDAVTRHHDVPEAFRDADPEAHFCLTLSHMPEIAPEIAEHGGHLILSGHTHGLQFDTPIMRRLARRIGMSLVMGAYPLDNGLLYVSQGLGSDLFPWRYRTRPEIALFELSAGPAPELTLERQGVLDIVTR